MEGIYKPEGMLMMTRENREYLSSVQNLERAQKEGRILEAPAVLCDSDMRLHISLGPMRGYIEREEAVFSRDGENVKDIAVITRVGKAVCFKILGFAEEGGERFALLSRRAAQEECVRRFLSALTPGDVIPARVTHLEPYGAFVDIGCGIFSLLSIDCISVSRIAHPRDRLRAGMPIFVAVKSIDPANGRIFVTQKELLGTWEENAAKFRAGETVAGRIRSIEPYGIFVELTPNLSGLAELRGGNGAAVDCAEGDLAAVYIKSILPERMKIKLVIVDAHAAPERPEIPTYYIDPVKTPHIDHWSYSPAGSRRIIETFFDA